MIKMSLMYWQKKGKNHYPIGWVHHLKRLRKRAKLREVIECLYIDYKNKRAYLKAKSILLNMMFIMQYFLQGMTV